MKFKYGDKIQMDGRIYNVVMCLNAADPTDKRVQGPRYVLENRNHIWSFTEKYILENGGKILNKINPTKSQNDRSEV